MLPRAASNEIIFFSNTTNSVPARLQAVADTARTLGIELHAVDVRSSTDLAPAFASLLAGGAEALNILASPVLFSFRGDLGRLSLAQKLPAMCQWREIAEVGCLASSVSDSARAVLTLGSG